MTTSITKITGTIALGAAVAFTGACGSSGPGEGGSGDAFLTIVGDRSVYLEHGDQTELQVRYHDRNDEALHGSVEFVIEGEPSGAFLASSAATTADNGIASVMIDANNDAQTTFTVRASAPEAGSVSWEITLGEPNRALNYAGAYRVQSNLDLVTGLEGNLGSVVNGVLDLTTDPGTFALVEISKRCCISEQQARTFGPVLTGLLEDRAPELVGQIMELGKLIDDNLKSFAVVSELTITGTSGAWDASHAVTGVEFRHSGDVTPVMMSELGQEPMAVDGISLAVEDRQASVTVGDHTLPMSYGAMLSIGIESVLIPAIDPNADSLADFLSDRIDCNALAVELRDYFDRGETFRWSVYGACELGVPYIANQAMERIENLDATGLALALEGQANAQDSSGNLEADVLAGGRWSGAVHYGDAAASVLEPLANRFSGERVSN